MTSVVQVRRWLQGTSAAERTRTAVVTTVVLTLLAVALVPAPGEPTGGGRLPGAQPSMDGAGAGGAVDPDGGAGDAALDGAGPVAPGARSAAPPSGTASGRAAGGGVAPGGTPLARLSATDRGVSAEAIKVGFTIVSLAAADDLGVSPSLRKDAPEAIDAFVDYANKRGGVLGRRIQPVKVSVDLVLPDDQARKCVELTETAGVFAVVDSFAFWTEPSTACITAQHKTLLVSGSAGSSQNVRLSFPYHVSVQNDDNRKMKDLVTGAKGVGFFDPARGFKKLGIFEDACSGSTAIFDSPTDGLKAYLSAAGVRGWSEFRIESCDPPSIERGAAQAVLQFRNAEVTHVLLAVHPGPLQSYLNAANRALFYPEYFAGDYYNLAASGLTAQYEPNGFDGALGVTQLHAGEGAIGLPLPPLTSTCSKILTDRGVAPVSSAAPGDIGDDLEILELCENFMLFLQVATAAGPNLTRSTWVNSLSGVGDFRGATTDLARFDRHGKVTGGDTVKLIKWHGSCRCWRQLTDFGPASD